jgi:hypothetical protein
MKRAKMEKRKRMGVAAAELPAEPEETATAEGTGPPVEAGPSPAEMRWRQDYRQREAELRGKFGTENDYVRWMAHQARRVAKQGM